LPGSTDGSSRISTLGIVTADRPQALERCVASYIRHLQHHGRSPRIVVVDDSKRSTNATATRRIATNARRGYDGIVQYVGAREKAAVRRALTLSGADPAAIDFGLPAHARGFAPGANRNHLLLATAGDLFLTADDDTVCRTWSAGDERRGLAFVGYSDPRQYAFFTSRRQALQAAHWRDIDLLGEHEAMLGQSLTTVAARARTIETRHACEHILTGLKSQDDTYQIRMTSSGVAGDGAMYSPYRFLFNPATVGAWAAIDRRTFDCALNKRETLRIVPQAAVSHQSATMMYSAGIDNRTLTPPFIPLGANEDGLFGVMLRLIAPMTFLAYAPVGIVHDSGRGPSYDGPKMPCISQTRAAELIVALLHDWAGSVPRVTPPTRLRRLGQHLVTLSAMPLDEFVARVVAASLDLWQRERERLDAMVAAMPGLPPFWLKALDTYRKRFLANAMEPAFFIPIEVKRRDSVGNGFRRTQIYLENLGRLIEAWPEIWSMARREGLYRP
jgi:hypothetical protein